MKSMSDGDVNDFVFKKLTDDLDDIEGKSMFDEAPQEAPVEGVKIEANGMSVHVKPMAGEQVKDRPAVMDDEDQEEDKKLGL